MPFPRSRITRGEHGRIIRAIVAGILVLPLGVPLISPALPAVREALGLSVGQTSLLITAYFLPGVFISPLVGVVADRYGRRLLLVVALFVFGLSGSAIALEPSFSVILALRVVQGTAAAGVFVAAATVLGDAFRGPDRNFAMGTTVAVLAVGRTVFPAAGGGLSGLAWNLPFALTVVAVPVGAYVWWTLPAGADEPALHDHSIRSVFTRESRGELVGLYVATFVIEALAFGAIFTALPFFLAAAFASAPLVIGLVIATMTLAMAATAFAAGRVAKRVSNVRLVGGCYLCAGLSLFGLWLTPTVLFAAAAAGLFGAGLGLAMPAVDAELSSVTDRATRGTALGLRNSMTFAGRAAGPILFALSATVFGFRSTMLGAGVIALLVVVVVMFEDPAFPPHRVSTA